MTDEELEAIPLLDCPSCDSHNTSVRRASNDWWLVGCLDCWNKRQCQRQFVEEVAALFSKELFDKFHVKLGDGTFCARFSPYGFEILGEHCMWVTDGQILNKLLTGKAVINNE